MTNPVTFTEQFRTGNTLETKTITILPKLDASDKFWSFFTAVCDTNGEGLNMYGTNWAIWSETGEEFRTIESLVWNFHELIDTTPETDLTTLEKIELLHFTDEETGEQYSFAPNYS